MRFIVSENMAKRTSTTKLVVSALVVGSVVIGAHEAVHNSELLDFKEQFKGSVAAGTFSRDSVLLRKNLEDIETNFLVSSDTTLIRKEVDRVWAQIQREGAAGRSSDGKEDKAE